VLHCQFGELPRRVRTGDRRSGLNGGSQPI
jgi:hypothetical protein